MNAAKFLPWFFPTQPLKLLDEHERWRRVAKVLKLPKEARTRLEWIIYYYEGQDATRTARHFGISRKTFYKWLRVFDQENPYSLKKLEDRSKAPKRVRQREITSIQEQRVIHLRKNISATAKRSWPWFTRTPIKKLSRLGKCRKSSNHTSCTTIPKKPRKTG